MLCRHKPGWAACFSNRIFSSLALSSALTGIPDSSRGIIFPWKGHFRKKRKKKKSQNFWMRRNCLCVIQRSLNLARHWNQGTKLYTWSPVPLRKHQDPITIMCLIYSESQRNKLFVIWISKFKRPGSTSCQLWNQGTNAALYSVVFAISLSCNNPIWSVLVRSGSSISGNTGRTRILEQSI